MKKKDWLSLLMILLATTLGSIVLNKLGLGKENILMVFMIGVLSITAFTKGYWAGLVSAGVSVIIFNYFFTEPMYTFIINSVNDMALMLFFLIASMISSSLTARFRQQLLIAQSNEQTAKLLHEIAHGFLNVTSENHIIHHGIRY
ncbi:MAG: sensor histidine kinase, partial [Clostridia bacterium]|nr:sensor histidine kinase [Clostridia bacterium]